MDVKKININKSELSYNIASEIYDVSSHNDGAIFESLQSLLSSDNLSTLIPSTVRYGGMSIRFIQSFNNKYVQFRYMSSSTGVTDFTNVVNWQGVDDVPTFGSKNLVESGGVYSEAINKLVIPLVGFATSGEKAGASQIGDVFFNTSTGLVRRKIGVGDSPQDYETIPLFVGATYNNDGHILTWNGRKFVSDMPNALIWKNGLYLIKTLLLLLKIRIIQHYLFPLKLLMGI